MWLFRLSCREDCLRPKAEFRSAAEIDSLWAPEGLRNLRCPFFWFVFFGQAKKMNVTLRHALGGERQC
ncbi:MAG: hypothetical protein AAF197_13095 [Pseudomonadota bacterium]